MTKPPKGVTPPVEAASEYLLTADGVILSNGDEELSELEVQQMLEQQDKLGGDLQPVIPQPEPAAATGPAFDPMAAHALDDAPVNSKIVVVKDPVTGANTAVLATPGGVITLPEGDPAHRLPEGARIAKIPHKDGGFRYQGTQLSAVMDYPPLYDESAAAMIARFTGHFHPTEPSGGAA